MSAATEQPREAVAPEAKPRRGRWHRLVLPAGIVLAVVLLAVTLLNGRQLSSDRTLDRQRDQAVSAGRVATEAMLSYDYRSLDGDVDAAKSQMTADYVNAYNDIVSRQVRPEATAKQGVNTAKVAQAAVIDARPGTVSLLLFVNTTFEQKDEDPVVGMGRLRVTMQQDGGRWLIDQVALL